MNEDGITKGYVDLAWAMLEQSGHDLATLCRWGLITPTGRCMPWPRCRRRNLDGSIQHHFYPVANMHGPNDHAMLKEFYNDTRQGQTWADLVGYTLPMPEVWTKTLHNNCGRQP
jgi:hypothetical protein